MAEPGVRFFRKTPILYDTELNTIYRDLPHGNSNLINIKGGKDPSFKMLDVNVASKPKFGAGEIDSLRLNIYGDSIVTGNKSSLINLAVYKIKTGNELGDNEGSFTLGTKNVTVIGAHADSERPWLLEGFDRTISQEDLDAEFESISTTITKKTDPYISIADAVNYQLLEEDYLLTRAEMLERHGDDLEGVGDVVFVEDGNWRYGEWIPKKGRKWYRGDPVWKSSKKHWHGGTRSKRVTVHYSKEVQVEAPVNEKQITQFNSIFDSKRSRHGYFEDKNSDGTPKYIASADVLQSTERVASGGTSALFNFIWDVDTDSHAAGNKKVRDFYPARSWANTATMGTDSNSDGTISGPRGRQEIFLTKKNIPTPIRTQSGNWSNSRYTGGTLADGGDCMFDAAIKLDMNFFEPEVAHIAYYTNSCGGDGGSDHDGQRKPTQAVKAGSPFHVNLRRATIFTMSDEAPDDTQDLYTFLSQNYCHNWQIYSHYWSNENGIKHDAVGGGSTHTTFKLTATGPCGNAHNPKKGRINIGDRVYFSHTNSNWLNHDCSFSGESGHAGRFYQNGHIVTYVDASTVTVNVKTDVTGEPGSSTQNANSHSDRQGYGTVFKYSNKNFFGMAFVNMKPLKHGAEWPNGDSNGTDGARRYFNLGGGTTDITTWKTKHTGLIPLPFTGRSIDNDNLTLAGTTDASLNHSWVPNATTQDFVHSCQSYGDLDGDYVDRWYNTLDTGRWYTLGFHFNPNSSKCYFRVNPTGKNSSEDYLDFERTLDSNGDPTEQNPASGHFMPNMKAKSDGKYHGNYVRDTSPDNWPSNMTVWGTNVDFQNQWEQATYDLPYQKVTSDQTGVAFTQGGTTTNSPWWMGYEDVMIDKYSGTERVTKSKVFLDQVLFEGFNLAHDNATVSLNNKSRKSIKFRSGNTREMFHYHHYPLERLYASAKPNITALAFGFDNVHDIESAKRYMLFNNFAADNISEIDELEAGGVDGNGLVNGNLFAGFSSDELRGHQIAALNDNGFAIEITRDTDTTPIVSATAYTSNHYDNRFIRVGQKVTGLGIGDDIYVTAVGDITSPQTFTISGAADNSGTDNWVFKEGRANLEIDVDGDSHIITTGTNQVDKFRGKGFVNFNFTDTTVHYNDVAMAKRENIAASARVVEFSKANNKVTNIKVDSDSIFNLDDGTKYIMYLYGSPVGTTADRIVDLTVLEGPELLDDGFFEVELSADVEGLGGAGMLGENIAKGIVMISPYKYWITMEINKEEDSAHSYGSVLMSGALTANTDSTSPLVAGFRGATYNESIYNDTDISGVYSPYANSHKFDFNSDYPIVELQQDYGLGVFDPEKDIGGMIKTLHPKVGWNEFKLDKVIDNHNDITHDDNLSFLVTPTDLLSDHSIAIRSKDHSTASSRPYMLTGIFDELPKEIQNFKVSPNKDNPFFPEFTWNTADTDLWYSFIMVDNKNIMSQYQNATLHYPLNETGADGTVITAAPVENITNTNSNTTIAGATYDVEGLAGYAVNFDGGSGTYIRSGNGSADPTAQNLDNFSVVLHAVHNSASITSDQNLLNQEEKLIIKAISGGQIEASLYADANSWVTLKSSSLVPTDGETPINIILTFDRSTSSNNVKLFINSVLEDQTGTRVAMNDASVSTGWHNTPINVNTNGNYLYIGNEANDTTTGWEGKIEEIVIYDETIYPVIIENEKFLFTTPLRELSSESSAQSKTNTAKLFVKDYHNIRGSRVTDVRASQTVSWRKAGFALDTT